MIDRSRRVVLLIDFDNLQICASRDTPGRDLQLEPVVQLAQRFGTVMVARAYAEWNLSTERLAVYKAGIEPAFAPVLRTESDRTGKSLADTVMVAEGMDVLWTMAPEVLVLATSDKDLIPLVRVAKQRGAKVVVVGSDFTAIPLREMADEHYTYKQLVTESGAKAGEGVPPRPQAGQGDQARRVSRRDRDRDKEREPREPRESREPREARPAAVAAAPAQAQPQAVPAATSAPEPVPSVSATSEAEGPLARRRRRRGSRRRTDRLGVGENEGAPEGASAADVAQASSGTVEAPGQNERHHERAEAQEAGPVIPPLETPPTNGVADEAPVEVGEGAAPARRTRRRTTGTTRRTRTTPEA